MLPLPPPFLPSLPPQALLDGDFPSSILLAALLPPEPDDDDDDDDDEDELFLSPSPRSLSDEGQDIGVTRAVTDLTM